MLIFLQIIGVFIVLFFKDTFTIFFFAAATAFLIASGTPFEQYLPLSGYPHKIPLISPEQSHNMYLPLFLFMYVNGSKSGFLRQNTRNNNQSSALMSNKSVTLRMPLDVTIDNNKYYGSYKSE